MSRDALKTLFHPFETGAVEAPAKGACLLFLNAEPGFRLPVGFDADLSLAQGFRPHFRALAAAGFAVKPLPEGDGFDGALVLCGRHRGQNEAWIAEALDRVGPGGLIMVGGGGEDGIASLRKRIEKLIPLEGHLPKYHGLAFWFRRPEKADAVASALRERSSTGLADGRFVTEPGMFSHERVDAGSRLLAENLPEHCNGVAADFGAGWGYLSAELAKRTAGMRGIDLYEADHSSLEAARRNLAEIGLAMPLDFFWRDLVAEKVEKKYDLIVMNPPFHQGRAAKPEIGRGMIKAASSSLKSGGSLFMVANRGLPYDETLKAEFSNVVEIRREAGFRVTVARR